MIERPRSAAETRAWLADNGLSDAVARAAAELPAELPQRVVELMREARRARRADAARRGAPGAISA